MKGAPIGAQSEESLEVRSVIRHKRLFFFNFIFYSGGPQIK